MTHANKRLCGHFAGSPFSNVSIYSLDNTHTDRMHDTLQLQ